ncbi:uncharacterized protein ARMOST_20770 [Armillaria ostoyae]|uniref:Uncharacterized protein n=1 Tax=Armillaria ostoyae TaxID=47428 RepID=A0A284S894_ARMOS|nr:uncharacterized protein ARMOST_20770 [Armillaria ostoyae]
MSNPTDVAVLVARANEAIQAADTLYEHKVELETLVKQCKAVCAIGAELVEKHRASVIGNAKNEDVVFRIKQVFERIQSDHSTVPTFKDYHTVRTFTGIIHSERDKRAAAVAAAIAVVTTPAESTPTKTTVTSGKPKASKAPAKRSRRLAKSRAIIEDSSDEEASVVAATEEDTIMGNPDASSTPPETDPVLIPSAAIRRKADTVISRFEQMNIDEDVDVIVNRDPTAGNIVEGHKVPLPKFLKNKKAAQAAQREKEKAERRAEAIQAAEATIAKGKAIEAANQARKRPRASADHAFKDSPYTIAAADLAINNEASQSTIDAAASLVVAGDHIDPSESVLRSREADLRNDVIATTHKIEYLLKYREFVVAHHGQVVKQLESRLPVPMEADSSAPVASGSKIN